ncbi:glycosyl hydrolase family 28-related protein [uncultured Desulfobulbus sp.]|uniref:glycosyl hydrolase family 28-related protein n=1 Tax=uncultured Desulfobulbus sp. TaxID=239745 RepID=UPI0029C844B1|nr:glycosyl hydrolase family 28-related protein [uncultured Desulfobulbus sp.]
MNKFILILMLSAICETNANADRLSPTFIVSNGATITASAVATKLPYNADNTGKLDATSSIQKTLDAVAGLSGGVVFLPAGKYRIDGSLKLGYGTALVGEWINPENGGIGKGTIFLAYGGRDDASGNPLIQSISSEAVVSNISVYYPEQKPDDIHAYPPTISASMATIENITLCNSYYALDIKAMNASVVSGIYGTALNRGVFAPESTEFSWMYDIHFSNSYWQKAADEIAGKPMSAKQITALNQYTKSNLVGIELQRLDGLAIYHFNADDAQTPICISKNPKFLHPVFGWGGVAADFKGSRDEQGWAPWYYFMRYANVDNVPEAINMKYQFAKTPVPSRIDKNSFIDVTHLPFNAAGDGIADDTTAVKQALSAASAQGGGTVYLPQGKYRITSPLVIPSGVELRGPYGAGKRRAFAEACTLEVYCGKDSKSPETDAAFITLEKNSGIRGFTISHPEQSYDVKQLHQYPYTIRGDGKGIWIVDIDLLNSCYGIDLAANRCDNHIVKGMWVTAFFKGINVGGNSHGGRLERLAFSVGTYSESGRISSIKTDEGNIALRDFISNNLVCYLFGDCVNEKTWGLVSFLPLTHFQFYKDKGQGCVDSDFWLTMQDVGKRYNILAESGRNIRLIGYFGSGSGEGIYNWIEVGKDFKGPLNVYAKTVQQTGINHPYDFTPQQVIFHDEESLTTGKKASASQVDPGSSPDNAVDRDERSFWQAPAGSYLEVDLGEIHNITGFGFVSAGMFSNLDINAEEAELQVSKDGKSFVKAGTAYARPGGFAQPHAYSWSDEAIKPVYTRYVRLYVTKPGADNKIRISTFNVYGY